MPCRNAGPYLHEAVQSVLAQPECLELLVADGSSSDGSLQIIEALAAEEPRLRIISRSDSGPADALNKAFRAARGTLIGWLNADDISPTGALARAVAALKAHPEWLMVYGEGEEFNDDTELTQRYPTLPASVGLEGFRSHCFICQPTVVFRRSMGVLLGAFDQHWHTAFDFDYWLRAFAAFPHRIGYVPHLQGRTRLHSATITSRQRAQVAMEATELLGRHFGAADATRLHHYGIELQLGLAQLPHGVGLERHLQQLFGQASLWLTPEAREQLQRTWLNGEPPAAPQPETCHWQPRNPPAPAASCTPFEQRPFGVNLIGHAFELCDEGDHLRMAAHALQAAGVPCCVIHHPATNGAPCSDRTLEPLLCSDPAGGPYAFNLVCLKAPIQARWLGYQGCDPLRERYTLCSWPWETRQWPSAWLPLLQVADELWPSSKFRAAALAGPAAGAGVPLQVMPMAAEINNPEHVCRAEARAATRTRHGLPGDAVLFGYGFDGNPEAFGRNPRGAVEAFQLAFPMPHLPTTFGQRSTIHPLSEQVALMIQSSVPKSYSAEWHWLQARAAEDSRINLIKKNLPREERLKLYSCCDVVLSLHRSEDCGQSMAEALQLGVDVIATDFGGNTDFCTGPLAHPVRWRPAPVPRGSHPCADGHSWAEPDLRHAAELCRKVAARRLGITGDRFAADPSRDPVVLTGYRERLSFASVGARYRARLHELWADRERVSGRLRWRRDRSPLGW